ncbi:hypothetical protein [Candidatus Aalborgicola defluviihabitans]|uniref:hypothetical protein n=1 Tax=Candidatus Aalborgicola defluviihabitans TaxID=3386187 RepID=UPI001DD7B4CB|nr:hypothetical protein [Burkholderiales bacterium]
MTPEILGRLEAYLAHHPYEKLDDGTAHDFELWRHGNPVSHILFLRLLAKQGEESAPFKRYFVSTHAHELAHMWFATCDHGLVG